MIKFEMIIHCMALLLFLKFIPIIKSNRGCYKKNPLRLVAILYIVFELASLFLNESDFPYFEVSGHKYYYYIVYSIFIIMGLVPILFVKSIDVNINEIIKNKGVVYAYKFLIVAIWFSFIYQLPYAIQASSLGANYVRDSMVADGLSILPESILTTISVVISSFYVIYILLFYVGMGGGGGVFGNISMFVGGALYIVSSLCFGGRDGIVFFIITNIFAYSLFYDSFDKKTNKIILYSIAIISVAAFVIMFAVTLERFGSDGLRQAISEGILGYIGQQPYVFSETLMNQNFFYGPDMRFPLFNNIFGGVNVEIKRYEHFEWSFGTYIKDFYGVSGWGSMVALCLTQAIIFSLAFHVANSNGGAIFGLLLVALYFQILTTGAFYFKLGTKSGNLYIVLYILLMCISYKKKQRN